MNLWHSLNGMEQMELTCADPAFALTVLNRQDLTLRDVEFVDAFTVRFTIPRQLEKKLRSISEKRGFEIKKVQVRGLFWRVKSLLKRPVLTSGVLILLLLGMYLPTRVLFFQVEGNVSVPTNLILEAAAECGICFGASRSEIRSEKMKNALLEAMPQLQWAGINTNGCVGIISVRERASSQVEKTDCCVGSIVAARDAVVTSCTATKGNLLCKVGQAVKAGQILISGYTDCGFVIRATKAEGEIFGRTERNLHAMALRKCEMRATKTVSQTKYALIFGKNRINLYFGSGISDTRCVKMYEEMYVVLPGGFQLPICIVKESWLMYDAEISTGERNCQQLDAFGTQYVLSQMVAGKIIQREESVVEAEDVSVLEGQYACEEMIGQLRSEEIVKPNGTDN